MFKKLLSAIVLVSCTTASAEDVQITGFVESKCTIHTEVDGVYGNPTPNKLSTNPSDGGVTPIIRYDVVIADNYKAIITTPNTFTSSPALNDVVEFDGSVSVSEVSDPAMSSYETNKTTFNESTVFDLTVAGSTWFKAESTAEYGYGKSLPGGTYRAIVKAECIAK